MTRNALAPVPRNNLLILIPKSDPYSNKDLNPATLRINRPMPRTDAATQEQLAHIQVLTRQAGLGNHSSHGIKAILRKHPVNGLGKSMVNEVI